MEYRINGANKILGRLASEIALILRGKNTPDFNPAKLPDVNVIVLNTDAIKVSGNKLQQKRYIHHSGYHGGLKTILLKDLMAKDSRKVLEFAIMGMLPKNKLRKKMIGNIKLFKKEEK